MWNSKPASDTEFGAELRSAHAGPFQQFIKVTLRDIGVGMKGGEVVNRGTGSLDLNRDA